MSKIITLTAIAAVSEDWGIGKDGDLLFNIPEDKKFFRDTTIGHKVIMGRKTFGSLPNGKPLPCRENIILSHNNLHIEGNSVLYHDVNNILKNVSKELDFLSNYEECFVIGGGEISKLLLPYCKRAIITRVRASPEADTFFPNLDDDWDWVNVKETEEKEYNGLKYKFVYYDRIMKSVQVKRQEMNSNE